MNLASIDDPKPKIIVISHERCGTHFLINTLCSCFGYGQYIEFGNEHLANVVQFYSPYSIKQHFLSAKGLHVTGPVKCHYPIEFFEGTLEEIASEWKLLYIHRNVYDTMKSWHRLINTVQWVEGPRGKTLSAFIRSEPCGYMMRHQMRQESTVIHRWLNHMAWKESGYTFNIAYEDLNDKFEDTVKEIGEAIKLKPISFDRPSKWHNVIAPADSFTYQEYTDDDINFIKNIVEGEL